jgi:hypothetical protein
VNPYGVTLRARLRVVLLIVGVVLVVGGFLSLLALNRVDSDARALVDHVSPATVQSAALTEAYLDEETGVRGYLLSHDESFLEPYQNGLAASTAAVAAIRSYLPDARVGAALGMVTAASDAWRTEYAEPAIAAAKAAPAGQQPSIQANLGKTRFDTLRAKVDALSMAISVDRNTGHSRLDGALTRLRMVGATAFLLVALAAVGLWFALRRLVLRPVAHLIALTRGGAAGHFEQTVTVRGPGEFGALADDVEAMRSRIVAELYSSRRAEAEIRAQAEALDA